MPAWLTKIRKILTIIADIFIAGREGGLWQKGNVPIVGQFTEKPLNPQSLLGLGKVKQKVKEKLVEAGIRNIQHRIDTPQERKVLLDGIHVPGMTEKSAWLLAIAFGLADMVLGAISTSDGSLLLTNWRAWLHSVVISIDWASWFDASWSVAGAKLFLWMKQDSHNSVAIIKQQTFSDVAEILAPTSPIEPAEVPPPPPAPANPTSLQEEEPNNG